MKVNGRACLPVILAAMTLAFSAAPASAAPEAPATAVSSFSLERTSAFTPTYDANPVAVDILGREPILARDFVGQARFGDEFVLGFGTRVGSLAGLFSDTDANAGAFRNLFADSAGVNAPYASLGDNGSFVSATVKLANDLHFTVAQSFLSPERDPFAVNPTSAAATVFGNAPALTDSRSVNATVASLNWNVANWAGLGVTASQTNERNGMLGNLDTDTLDIGGAKTSAVGVSGRVGLGDGWVTTASYSIGLTQVAPKRSGFLTDSDLRTRSYGVAVAKNGLFGHNDALGLAVSRPIQAYTMAANLLGPVTFDKSQALNIQPMSMLQTTKTPETDFELGYVTTFFDGALALQTNAAYQMNLQGQNGKNGLAVVTRTKINF
jgi:hypothetical protein